MTPGLVYISMIWFLSRRVLSGIALVFVVTSITALLIYSGGADIARNLLGETASQDAVDLRAEQLGLNLPLWQQYWNWAASAITGDFGASYINKQPVLDAIGSRLPVTLSVVLVATLISGIISALLGIIAALRRGWVDRTVQLVNVVGTAIPPFWLALFLVVVFALNLGLFPATGYVPFIEDPRGWAMSVTLPVVALVVGGVGSGIVRASIIEVLGRDYVRTLRARGLSEKRVVFKHVLRNASPPFLTSLSLQFVGMLGGSVMIEKVFALPGIGTLANTAAQQSDIPVLLGVVSMTVFFVVIVNIGLDILLSLINPKVRVQ